MKSKGFTLIEMVIVITILGIIVAIAVPQFMDKKEKRINPLQNDKVIDQNDTTWYKRFNINTNQKYKITIWNEDTGTKETRWFIVEDAK